MTCIIVKPCYDEVKIPSVGTNASEKSNLNTNEISLAGDAPIARNIVSENSTESGIVSDCDLIKRSEIVTSNGEGQPSDKHTSNNFTTVTESTSTSLPSPQKQSADKILIDDDHNERQQTENSDLELS